MLYSNQMKIYLDACCLNRPFDDQSQPRVRLETEAISLILEKLQQNEWEWVGSEMLIHEIKQNPDLESRQRVLLFLSRSHQTVEISDKILQRAGELEETGFDSYDAIHLASAEYAKVVVFLTTDDEMLKVIDALPLVVVFVGRSTKLPNDPHCPPRTART